MACFFRGLAYANQQKYTEAANAFAQAAKQGYDAKSAELHRAGALRRAGQTEEAKKILAGLEKLSGSSGEYHFQQGACSPPPGSLIAASAEFEKTLSLERDHNGALFELAYINDLYGNDDLALEYLQAVHRSPARSAGRLDQSRHPLRRRDAVSRRRAVLSPGLVSRTQSPPCPALLQGLPGEQGDVLRRGGRARVHGPQATARDPRHRLRAVGPKPQLPAEDEHPHARRPDADDRDRASVQQEFRRDLARRNQGDDAGQGLAAGDVAGRRRTRPATTIGSSSRRKFRPSCRRS